MINKYHRFQLTSPYEGSVIYESRSLRNASKNCYKEFLRLKKPEDIKFTMTDLDTNTEYHFEITNNFKQEYNIYQ